MEGTKRRDGTGLAVLALVLLLLAVQFWLGFLGFDRPHDGLLGLLEAPGALLGWGGVLILAILVAWLMAGWVGRDLFGLRGPSGLAVRLVGVIALGVAVAGILGLIGGLAVGGEVGAWLGDLLENRLGTFTGAVLLLLMATPSFVLSVSPFFRSGAPPRRDGGVPREDLAELEPKPGLYEGSSPETKPLYPERRYDEDGHEIPMTFGGHDVGQIHYADETGESAGLESIPPPEPVEPTLSTGQLPRGVRYADEAEPDGEEVRPSEHEEVRDARIPLPTGVRYVDGEEEEQEEQEEDREEDEEIEEGEDDLDEGEKGDEDEEDEGIEEGEEDEIGPPAAKPVPRLPIQTPQTSVTTALDATLEAESGARYRAKLESSGIFDDAPPSPPPPPRPTPAKKKPAAKKKTQAKKKPTKKPPAAKRPKPAAVATATTKKKRKKKTTTTGTKKKTAARKSESTPKKKTGPKKKATPTKKAGPTKKGPKKKSTTGSKSRAGSTSAETPKRKGSRSRRVVDEAYRKAVSVAMERGAASSVLLSRRLGIGYARARALIEQLAQDGILGEMTPSGSRPLLITEEEWKASH